MRLDIQVDLSTVLEVSTPGYLRVADRNSFAAARGLGRILRYYRPLARHVQARAECLRLIHGHGSTTVLRALADLPPEWADHAIACIYAVLMPRRRRKELGAYFTPPHLVNHLLQRMEEFGLDITKHAIRDPAAGGAAFLVPLARRMVARLRVDGVADPSILALLKRRLLGTEVDRGLADIANALLRRMLVREWDFSLSATANVQIVRVANALSRRNRSVQTTHEVGNPPYRRLTVDEHATMRERFADIAAGRLNLYSIFMRRAIGEVPAGGLIGHVIPTSFLGGPEFSAFRRRLLELADVLVIDLVSRRSDVFVDATQDACFIVLRKRNQEVRGEHSWASSGILHSRGIFTASGDMRLTADGSPWHLPGLDPQFTSTLEDWGYRASIGYLVPFRQAERMHARCAKGRFPLVWARAIGQDGSFDHARGASAKRLGWVSAPSNARYIVRDPCVVVQRTSARDQRRRVVAAAVPDAFLREHGRLVGENHILLLVRSHPDAPSPAALAHALNDPLVSQAMNRVCGSASIPIGAIQMLRLPPPKSR